MSGRFVTTTKDIGLLKQLFDDGQLQISAEFQRNAIWPRAAKAFLIDSILVESPIPVLYFQKGLSAHTNRVEYTVVDGQQRLNAVFQFMENRFSLTESEPGSPWYKKNWKTLDEDSRRQILSYDFVVQELIGYHSSTIRDMFRRMNRYVVALNPQELRHAAEDGAFKRLVERIGSWPFWMENKVVTRNAANRMKQDELVAELLILLNEGPQDKKESVNFYYKSFGDEFEAADRLEAEMKTILQELVGFVPGLKSSPLRKPANIYGLIGAISEIRAEGLEMPRVDIVQARLERFVQDLEGDPELRPARAAAYWIAQSRQTDNIRPRKSRIEILRQVIMGEE